jgi:hypothetical protein
MRHTTLIFILTLLVLGRSFSQPKLSLNKSEIDLGTIYSGMKKQGKIVLRNIGNDTLRIYTVQPSCGCTTAKQPKSILLPSESDVVEVEFNSSGYHGKVAKHVSIITNDPLSQNVSVTLLADVKEELESLNHSTFMWLGNITLGKSLVQGTFLKNISNHNMRIKNITTSSPALDIKIEKKVLQPNDTLAVQVTVKPDKLGYGTENFTIETDSKNQPLVEIKASYVCVQVN